MPRKETKIIFLIILGANIVALGFLYYLYSTMTGRIAGTIRNEDDIRIEIKKEETLSLMKKDIEDAKHYNEVLSSYFVAPLGIVDFFKTLEDLAFMSGIEKGVSVSPAESPSSLDTAQAEIIGVKMNIVGRWEDAQLFLALLEHHPLKIDIKRMSLNKFSEHIVQGRVVPQWSGVLEFTVLKLKDK
jgi:hypothetical protein